MLEFSGQKGIKVDQGMRTHLELYEVVLEVP
jgi:hypothetical protein